MPNTMITIEQLGERWVAEIEIGGMVAVRRVARGASFEEIMDHIYGAYREAMPTKEARPPRVPDVALVPVQMPPSRIVTRNKRRSRSIEQTPPGAFDEGEGDGSSLEEMVNRERVHKPSGIEWVDPEALDATKVYPSEPFRRPPGRPRKYA